jgi:hypothetical protein
LGLLGVLLCVLGFVFARFIAGSQTMAAASIRAKAKGLRMGCFSWVE